VLLWQWALAIAGGLIFLMFVTILLLRRRSGPFTLAREDGKQRTQIVILGGGFGGVYTAQRLEQLLGNKDDYEITLINKENYLVFQPMLAEVIGGHVGVTDTVSPLRSLLPGTNIHVREIENVDLESKTVTLSPGFLPRAQTIKFDHLVFAVGNVTDFKGMRGLPEHALPFKTLADAVHLRNHLIHALEEAAIEHKDEKLRKQLLTFVIAGGGFSGVECAADLNDFVRASVRNYRQLDPKEVRVCLLHAQNRILPEMDEKLALFAQDILRKRGVEILLDTRLEACTAEAALLKDKPRIETKTLISTIPSSPSPVIEAVKSPLLPKSNRGKIICENTCQVKGSTNLWALGDCGDVPSVEGGNCPPTAQHAMRQGAVCADNIVAAIRGGEKRAFLFKGLGKMGALGHHCAVAEVLGIKISGLMAWAMWRVIYLMKMPGWARRIKVATSWVLGEVLEPDLVQLKLGSKAGISQEHFEPGQAVFEQGDLGDRIYIILKGEADVVRNVDGNEVPVARLRAGEYFGEMALLSQTSRGATVRAVTPMDALSLPKREFGLLAGNLPDFKKSFDAVAERRKTGAHPKIEA
jgi:NADH dehydrogenase